VDATLAPAILMPADASLAPAILVPADALATAILVPADAALATAILVPADAALATAILVPADAALATAIMVAISWVDAALAAAVILSEAWVDALAAAMMVPIALVDAALAAAVIVKMALVDALATAMMVPIALVDAALAAVSGVAVTTSANVILRMETTQGIVTLNYRSSHVQRSWKQGTHEDNQCNVVLGFPLQTTFVDPPHPPVPILYIAQLESTTFCTYTFSVGKLLHSLFFSSSFIMLHFKNHFIIAYT